MAKSQIQLFKFGEFQLDTLKRVLLQDNTPVQLPSRAFDVLLALVEHNQTIIDKEELMQLVWGERVVEENNLTRHISTLRKVLDESPNDHRYIVTVPGRGYSFVAEVVEVSANGLRVGPETQNGQMSAVGFIDADQVDNKNLAPATEAGHLKHSEPAKTRTKSVTVVAPASHIQKRWLSETVLIVALTCFGLLGLVFVATRSKPGTAKSYRDWEVIRLTRTGGSTLPAISPDGRFVAYVDLESGQESVWLLQLATSVRYQLVPPERYKYFDLEFSSDGNELFFTRREGNSPQRALYRIPMLGGIGQKLRDDIDSSITLSPDGSHLAFARLNDAGKSQFIIASVDGVEERVLLEHGLQFPEWSPDGQVIAYSVGDAGTGADNMSLYQVQIADSLKKEISSRRWVFVGNKSWLPDGSGLIVSGRQQKTNATQLWFVPYPSGEARQLSDNFNDFIRARLTSDGRVMVAEELRSVSDIWSGPLADMAHASKIGVWGRAGVSFLADGRVVYSSLQSGEVGKIWITDVAATGPKQLTTDSANDISPVASPDGRYIVFCSNRSGNNEIWRMDVDGGNVAQLTHSKGATFPSISPDGRWVIYLSRADSTLYKIPVNGGQPQRVGAKAVGVSAVSPDGKLIAYFAPGKETWEIAVNSFENGSLVKTFKVGSHSLNNASLKWKPDGRDLLYAASTNGVGNIWMQPLDGSASSQVTNFKENGIFSFDVSSDGKDLVCARGEWKHDVVLIKNLR
jgi:Tol biopolymer transport system component/DNA-binding winged helix-turn-helix (wHTH) protein